MIDSESQMDTILFTAKSKQSSTGYLRCWAIQKDIGQVNYDTEHENENHALR